MTRSAEPLSSSMPPGEMPSVENNPRPVASERPGPYFRPHLLVDAPLAGLHLSLAATGHWAALAAVTGGIIGLHAWASMYPRSPWYVRTHTRLPASETACALTFDDGPHPEYTPRVLDELAAHGMQATFFVIGVHAQQHGALLRRILAEGHSLGLHSWRHPRWFSLLTTRRVKADLRACGDAIAEAACVYLDAPVTDVTLSKGLASRHLAAAAISQVSQAVAIAVSQSSGTVRLFLRGEVVLHIEPLATRPHIWQPFRLERPDDGQPQG